MQLAIDTIPNIDLATKAGDTRRAVGDSAETIGAAASELGREALKIGRDAAKLTRIATRRGLLLVAGGGEALRRASNDAATTIEDLRSYQIVRRRRGPDWRPGIALAIGAGAGLAAMYLLDPEQGRRRRVQLMDQLNKFARTSSARLNSAAQDLRNRSQGLAIEARRAVEQARGETSDYLPENGVMGGPDVSNELASTDWPAEPAATELSRSSS
jgi:hypothetical protein